MRKRHANLKDHILRKVGVELGEGITLLRALPLASLVGQKAYPENSNYILQGVHPTCLKITLKVSFFNIASEAS